MQYCRPIPAPQKETQLRDHANHGCHEFRLVVRSSSTAHTRCRLPLLLGARSKYIHTYNIATQIPPLPRYLETPAGTSRSLFPPSALEIPQPEVRAWNLELRSAALARLSTKMSDRNRDCGTDTPPISRLTQTEDNAPHCSHSSFLVPLQITPVGDPSFLGLMLQNLITGHHSKMDPNPSLSGVRKKKTLWI